MGISVLLEYISDNLNYQLLTLSQEVEGWVSAVHFLKTSLLFVWIGAMLQVIKYHTSCHLVEFYKQWFHPRLSYSTETMKYTYKLILFAHIQKNWKTTRW